MIYKSIKNYIITFEFVNRPNTEADRDDEDYDEEDDQPTHNETQPADDEDYDEEENNNDGEPLHFPTRHSLGRMEIICPNCRALHWIDERLSISSRSNPLFGKCCLSGNVRLPALLDPPEALKVLYEGNDTLSKSFRRHIQQYNAANAFTSLGCSMDRRILTGRGPYSFVIHGELRHRTGALVPEPGAEPSYAQLYIYDFAEALESRERRNPNLDRRILNIIQQTLLQYNPFVTRFKQAHEILEQQAQDETNRNLPAYLHYNPRKDQRRYNAPTVDEIAVILPGDGTQKRVSRDIVVHGRGDQRLMRISECHPAYLPLHYVLLFPFGELGWDDTLIYWDVSRNAPTIGSRNKLTMMDYYSYRLFRRENEYSTILRDQNLFQELIVDA